MNYLEKIRALREDNDLTQAELDKKLKLSQRVYSNYETGQRSLPIDVLCDLADFYNTTTDYILCRTNNRNKIEDIQKNKKSS